MKKIFIFAAILLLFIGCKMPTNSTPSNNIDTGYYDNYAKTAFTGRARLIYSNNTVEEVEGTISFIDVTEQYDFQNNTTVFAPGFCIMFIKSNEHWFVGFCEELNVITPLLGGGFVSFDKLPTEMYVYKTDGSSLHLYRYFQ